MKTARDYLADDARRLADRAELLQDHGPPDPAVTGDFAQSVSDIYREFGSSAPLPLRSESPRGYELRVISELQRQIPDQKPVPLSALAALPDSAFQQQRDQIIASARTAAQSYAPPGTLRERKVRDAAGLTCTEFAGDPRVWLSHFMRPAIAVARFKNADGSTRRPNRTTVG
jgi:hypothetical protein